MGTLSPGVSYAFPAATSSLAVGRNPRSISFLYVAQDFACSRMVKSHNFDVSYIAKKRCSGVSRSRLQHQSPLIKRSTICYAEGTGNRPEPPRNNSTTDIQLYSQIERLITETARQSQEAWGGSEDWSEIEGAWVLRPKNRSPTAVVHFVGGIFVGAAPQLTYRLFLERLSKKGALVIATPFASGFDHFLIADEVQFKFDRCLRFLQDSVNDLPTFGIGHSLGSVIHLLIGSFLSLLSLYTDIVVTCICSRYAVQRCGNILMAFNNKEASSAVPLFSPVIVPMAQSIGPLLSQLTSSPSLRRGVSIHISFLMLQIVSYL
ncbi:hypothetical protein ZIOFF_035741 [Zingiber officinale]|uniref:Uncharacterized protein n=1 Tax=Zingiber officinale TaxID=94328 RepID=A0A8J5GKY4_ZINOF|nr:hypothetical protein ZIOFF_035741 [Zingiber officinale]